VPIIQIQYSVDVFGWHEVSAWNAEQTECVPMGYWKIASGSPGGSTIEEAHKRVKEDIEGMKFDKIDMSKVKIKIIKTVLTSTTEEELIGADFTALMLK